MSVAQERTGWRDLAFSKRHRLYGDDCTAVDLDYMPFRLDEYYRGEPVGLIEYKNENVPFQNYSKPNFQALINLGNKASLPVYCVYSSKYFSRFIVDPLNHYAEKFFMNRTKLTEHNYVKFLHDLRGIKVHDRYIDYLLSKGGETHDCVS